MTEIKNDGGPAFPAPTLPGVRGMSLRDYFAAAFLQGVFSANAPTIGEIKGFKSTAEYYSWAAYKYADAMLEARK